jgi:branched-chain amino acid aminotransferase
MRRYLLEKLPDAGFKIKEISILPDDLEFADEVFLTNAINGMRWVKQYRSKVYTNAKTVEIYNRFVTSVFLSS